MSRLTIDRSIAYDDVRKLYYVTLVWGLQPNGEYKKASKTARNKKEAKQILKAHEKVMAAGTAIAPVKVRLLRLSISTLIIRALILKRRRWAVIETSQSIFADTLARRRFKK